MRKLIKTLFIILIIVIIIFPILLFIFGIESKPLVVRGNKLNNYDVARAKQLIKQNNPRLLKEGQIKNVYLKERDLNLFLDYVFVHSISKLRFRARIRLFDNSANLYFTGRLPRNPIGKYYVNLSCVLTQSGSDLSDVSIDKLKIGSFPLPGWLAEYLIEYAYDYLKRYDEFRVIAFKEDTLKDIQIRKKRMLVVYQWSTEVMEQLQTKGRRMIMSDSDQKKIDAYNALIADISSDIGSKKISLSNVFQSLFQLAKKRTAVSNNPLAENRALILALAINSTGMNIDKILGLKNKSGKQADRLRLTLQGRPDLSKHFLVSAAITVSGSAGLANLAGLFKEIDDSMGGSGFSFADLAADRAGVKMAQNAIHSSARARTLQQRMSGSITENNFMPRIDNLSEGIMELQFKRKYKDLNSSAYSMIDREIKNRISGCSVYR